MHPYIGRALPRREDPHLLTGAGAFAGDMHPPGTVHLAIRRAGVPSGSNLRVDLDAARSVPGVVGAWAAGELGLADDCMPDPPGSTPRFRRPVLARGTVRFEGEAVAVVAAESPYQAIDAAEAIQVDVDPAPLPDEEIARRTLGYGDASAAVSEPGTVAVRQRLGMARICGGAMEPRAVLAQWSDADGTLRVQGSIGWAHGLRNVLAHCLGLDPNRVTAIARDVGGSFGAKNHPYPEYVIAAAVSRALRRPARWVATRSEDGHTTGQSHSVTVDLELAADAEGRLRALRGDLDFAVGAYEGSGAGQDESMTAHMMSTYRLPALEIRSVQHYSPGPPAAHIRGGGRPVGNFAIERMMDRLARRLGLDPVEVRRRNLVPPSAMPYPTGYGEVVYDGGDYPRLLELATARAGLAEVRARQGRGELVGAGVAMCAESTGIGRPEPSRVVVRPDGGVEAVVGSTPQGQGHETFVAQVVADRLGWPIEQVEVRAGDSSGVPMSMVTAGSRSALEVGNSVALSAASARRRLLELASERLEAGVEDIVVGPEGATVRGVPDRRIPLAELVGDGVTAAETWDSQGARAWSSSCHVAVVRLDADTGGVAMERYVIAHDSGRAINPLLVEGQLQGGYAHGLGYALFEEAVYAPDGTFLSPSFLDYTLVSAPEVACEPELIHTETASSQNPEGFRGVGEAGTIAVPAAVANAVEDALHAAGVDAVVDQVPVTPQRLWSLLAARR